MNDDSAVEIDLERLHEMAGGCGWSLTEFADFYAPRAEAEVAAMRDAASTGESDTLSRLAHGAAGSSASVGMVSLSARYRRIEDHPPGGDADALDGLIADARSHLSRVLARLREIAGDSG